MSAVDGKVATVFVSSTNLDLDADRKEAVLAANAAGCLTDIQENWTAEDHPPLDKCLERVDQADVLVVILAHRYGWIPEDDARNPNGKSITWLECEEAVAKGKHVLAFVVDESADWPEHLKDEADLKRAAAMTDVAEAMELFQATHTSIQRLRDFKQWLGSRGLRRTFRTKEELKLEVERALKAWRSRQAEEGTRPHAREAAPAFIPSAYLQWVRRECESVELLGLEAQELHPTRLSQVYVPAATPAKRSGGDPSDTDASSVRQDRPNTTCCSNDSVGNLSMFLATRERASPPSAAGSPWLRPQTTCRPIPSRSRKRTRRPILSHCGIGCRC
jgi:hypothetical protein